MAFASAEVLVQWRVQFRMRKLDTTMDWTPIYRSNLRDVREMAAAGVPILSGTDVPVPSLVPGFSLHDELALLVTEGGLTPLQALQAATLNPARTFGLGDSLGTVSPGAVA